LLSFLFWLAIIENEEKTVGNRSKPREDPSIASLKGLVPAENFLEIYGRIDK